MSPPGIKPPEHHHKRGDSFCLPALTWDAALFALKRAVCGHVHPLRYHHSHPYRCKGVPPPLPEGRAVLDMFEERLALGLVAATCAFALPLQQPHDPYSDSASFTAAQPDLPPHVPSPSTSLGFFIVEETLRRSPGRPLFHVIPLNEENRAGDEDLSEYGDGGKGPPGFIGLEPRARD